MRQTILIFIMSFCGGTVDYFITNHTAIGNFIGAIIGTILIKFYENYKKNKKK